MLLPLYENMYHRGTLVLCIYM